jgi:hypothetical protein
MPCDKCGLHVPENNDVVQFDMALASLEGHPEAMLTLLCATPRHLLPVIENGIVLCEGSPSRAQYLEGQQPDSRLAYAYRPENEALYRNVYARMQEVCHA